MTQFLATGGSEMSLHRVRVCNVVAALCLAMVVVGCGGPPSPADGRKIIEGKIGAESNGLIKLVSFDKTNGVEQEFLGMKLYEMEYSAEIEFLEDCMWGGGAPLGWDGSFSAVAGQPGNALDAFNPMYFGKSKATKGQRQKVSGKLMFQITENGWRQS